jgi:hypothetical protein
MNLSSASDRIRDACRVRGLRLHTPMPPEIDPDAPPPPAVDPDPVPNDDPANDPSRAPEGDPPMKPPPVATRARCRVVGSADGRRCTRAFSQYTEAASPDTGRALRTMANDDERSRTTRQN